jgi:hypothetical protein
MGQEEDSVVHGCLIEAHEGVLLGAALWGDSHAESGCCILAIWLATANNNCWLTA